MAKQLTDLEFAVCAAIDESEYGDWLQDDVWTFSVVGYFNGKKNQLAGAVASLVKKGLAGTSGKAITKFGCADDEATVGLTDAGAKAYLADCAARGVKARKNIFVQEDAT